jgi:hypothetical protein
MKGQAGRDGAPTRRKVVGVATKGPTASHIAAREVMSHTLHAF